MHRRSFSQKNLNLSNQGPQGVALARALVVPEKDGYEGIHGFHPYPGRFHPQLVGVILDELHRGEKGVLLDPFMGSGTTLIEARRRGWAVWGNDLNPVALQLTRVKLLQLPTALRQALRRSLLAVAEYAGQKDEWIQHPQEEMLRKHYRPHTYVEMLSLWDVIQEFDPGIERDVAEMMLSAASTKFSALKSDSVQTVDPHKAAHPKGAVFRWWSTKTYQLIEALEHEAKRSPHVKVDLSLGDALSLPQEWEGGADLVLTSPPYPGTYDYASHHGLRSAWLGLSDQDFRAYEIGSRRSGGGQWDEEGEGMLRAIAKSLRPEGLAYIVLGDWLDQDQRVSALEWVQSHAKKAGLMVESSASVQRENFEQARQQVWNGVRGEHLIRLRKAL